MTTTEVSETTTTTTTAAVVSDTLPAPVDLDDVEAVFAALAEANTLPQPRGFDLVDTKLAEDQRYADVPSFLTREQVAERVTAAGIAGYKSGITISSNALAGVFAKPAVRVNDRLAWDAASVDAWVTWTKDELAQRAEAEKAEKVASARKSAAKQDAVEKAVTWAVMLEGMPEAARAAVLESIPADVRSAMDQLGLLS